VILNSTRRFTGGYINVDKSQDWSSTDVVRKLKGIVGMKKIGHGGTLDPMATGVLPVCLGSGTKFAEMVLLGTKKYLLTVTLGSSTNTYDTEGEVTAEGDFSSVTRAGAEEALGRFRGRIEQPPPMFSAVKHGGKRLYELARQGIEVERKARSVEVFELQLLRWALPAVDLRVECSHGFYARSLAHDLGVALGVPAHLSALRRTQAGPFGIETAHTIDEIEESADAGRLNEVILPVDFTLQHLPPVRLDPLRQEAVQHGRALPVGEFGLPGRGGTKPGQQVRAYGQDGELIAILKFEPEKLGWRPEKVLLPL